MTPLNQRTVYELFTELSASATPGGGAIAILSGYLGVGLIMKALRVSARKRPDLEILRHVAAQLEELSPRLVQLADADNAAFQEYLNAAKMPKASSERNAARGVALERAAETAAVTALEAMEMTTMIIKCASRAEDQIAPVIRADLTAGIELLRVLCIVAKENAEANLSGITDELKKAVLKRRLAQ